MTTSATDPLLDVVELRTGFRTRRGLVRAVDGVSFSLAAGRTLGVVGESGSGKTVLSRSIMGLLPIDGIERSGQVMFAGRDLMQLDRKALRKVWGAEIAMVFQDPMASLNPVVRVGRQLTEAIRTHLDASARSAQQDAESLLASVRVPDPAKRMHDYPHELSGGMRQRVMIAMALACGPSLLLADEPTTALDVTVQSQILDLLEEVQADRFMAMILVTHDLGVVAGAADEILVMYAGRIVEHAPTGTLFEDMKMPYTEALMQCVPKLSDARHTRLAAIEGRTPDLVNPPPGCAFAPRCAYAQDRCRIEAPPLRTHRPGHRFACWYPVGTPEGDDALARNRVVGVSTDAGFRP